MQMDDCVLRHGPEFILGPACGRTRGGLLRMTCICDALPLHVMVSSAKRVSNHALCKTGIES